MGDFFWLVCFKENLILGKIEIHAKLMLLCIFMSFKSKLRISTGKIAIVMIEHCSATLNAALCTCILVFAFRVSGKIKAKNKEHIFLGNQEKPSYVSQGLLPLQLFGQKQYHTIAVGLSTYLDVEINFITLKPSSFQWYIFFLMQGVGLHGLYFQLYDSIIITDQVWARLVTFQ